MSEQPELAPSRPAEPTRRIDARSLRGLAHPLRMHIFELLSLDGPATATKLAERLGENTGTVSWHLRHLARHGFIEEEAERGTRRERWWRRVDVKNELDSASFHKDSASDSAPSIPMPELVQQCFNRVLTFVNEEWGDGWRSAGTISDWVDLRLTPDQLKALSAELSAVIARHTPPSNAEPDPDALPVVVQLQSFPLRGRKDA
ncbi:helix-turn-helix domain-containing protein [Streptomyces cinnabarinus]|uniref:Helix-turn-helix domain-containing protein n=1 Tax=Streptomyces cinnabarinus TaxID=67287 RepID=A0ABY7KTW3_9ACTN|nr:helix-turn-helix domain-containing protein [Streptomyces cinnabarinus]WAZ26958.1 helix-turn-helix domain-containing protein [Streptomyces cinnabarinus]